jgi:hypothetical protein
MTEQQEIAKATSIALELIRLQHSEIEWLKASVFALRDFAGKGAPTLADAEKQVRQEMKESGYRSDEVLPLLNEHLKRMWALSKQSPKRKPAAKRVKKRR